MGRPRAVFATRARRPASTDQTSSRPAGARALARARSERLAAASQYVLARLTQRRTHRHQRRRMRELPRGVGSRKPGCSDCGLPARRGQRYGRGAAPWLTCPKAAHAGSRAGGSLASGNTR
jgi:hypothetical protein